MSNFAAPLSKLAESGIGVAAAPTGGQGLSLDVTGRLPNGILFKRTADPTNGQIDYGQTGTTFTASANSAVVTVPHNLGRVPVIVIATGNKDGVSTPVCQVGNFTSSSFDLIVHDADNTARTGNTTVYWLAIG